MDAVTYPTTEASKELKDFIAVKLDTTAWQQSYLSILQRTSLTWTPTFVVTDGGGREVRRWSGFEPPQTFAAELHLALAAIDRLHGRPEQAHARLAPIAGGGTPLAAEAIYWQGVARFNQSGDKHDLLPSRDELLARHPASIWAQRADCLEALRPADGP